MPIDSSIALGIRPANLQQQDPLESYGKGLALKSLMNKSQLEESALADDTAVRGAYQQAGGDSARLRALLQGGGQYKAIQALDKFELDKRKDEAEIGAKLQSTEKSKHDVHIDRLERGAALFSLAKDQPSYESAIRHGVLNGIFDPQAVQHFPKEYSPEVVQQLQIAGMKEHDRRVDQRAREGMDVTRRGQDMTAASSEAGRRTTERGQDLTNARAVEAAGRDKMQIVTDTDGNITVVDKNTRIGTPATDADGNILKGRQNMTESQGKASGMALRAREANGILNKLEAEGVTNRGVIKQGAEGLPLIGEAAAMGVNALPRVLGGPSGQQQQVEQARRNFVNAVLRVESGASINEGEFRNAEKQYFPMPGDTDAVKKQKAANRETAIAALELQSGPQKSKPAMAAPARRDSIGGVLKQNPDGSFNYGF